MGTEIKTRAYDAPCEPEEGRVVVENGVEAGRGEHLGECVDGGPQRLVLGEAVELSRHCRHRTQRTLGQMREDTEHLPR
jgi:hypothetical protein